MIILLSDGLINKSRGLFDTRGYVDYGNFILTVGFIYPNLRG